MTAFKGPELEQSDWVRLFSHFINLSICEALAKYIKWHSSRTGLDVASSSVSFRRVAALLGVGPVTGLEDLLQAIDQARIDLEIYINNFDDKKPALSQLQSPVRVFFEEVQKLPGHGLTIFHVILDEYENFLDYQQQIVNTLIKHCGDNYFFKVGVKELGWRVRYTLNENETLISPADYDFIHIETRLGDNFAEFARRVCAARLSKVVASGSERPLPIERLLPSKSIKEEAEDLGVGRRVTELRHLIQDPDASTRHRVVQQRPCEAALS